jgi:hypothetical protein
MFEKIGLIVVVISCLLSGGQQQKTVSATETRTGTEKAGVNQPAAVLTPETEVTLTEGENKLVELTLMEIRPFGNGVYYIPKVRNDVKVRSPSVSGAAEFEVEYTAIQGAVFARFSERKNLRITSSTGDSNIVMVSAGPFAYTTNKGYWVFTEPKGELSPTESPKSE